MGEIHSKKMKSIDQCNHILFIKKPHQKIQYPILKSEKTNIETFAEPFINELSLLIVPTNQPQLYFI